MHFKYIFNLILILQLTEMNGFCVKIVLKIELKIHLVQFARKIWYQVVTKNVHTLLKTSPKNVFIAEEDINYYQNPLLLTQYFQ